LLIFLFILILVTSSEALNAPLDPSEYTIQVGDEIILNIVEESMEENGDDSFLNTTEKFTLLEIIDQFGFEQLLVFNWDHVIQNATNNAIISTDTRLTRNRISELYLLINWDQYVQNFNNTYETVIDEYQNSNVTSIQIELINDSEEFLYYESSRKLINSTSGSDILGTVVKSIYHKISGVRVVASYRSYSNLKATNVSSYSVSILENTVRANILDIEYVFPNIRLNELDFNFTSELQNEEFSVEVITSSELLTSQETVFDDSEMSSLNIHSSSQNNTESVSQLNSTNSPTPWLITTIAISLVALKSAIRKFDKLIEI